MDQRTITAKEAANYLGISYWLLLEMVKKNLIPCIELGIGNKKRKLFRVETLDKWIDEQELISVKQDTQESEYGKLRKIY